MSGSSLRDAWDLRCAAAETLLKSEAQLRHLLGDASTAEIGELLESFSSGRSPSPEWSRSFEWLTEHLWAWCEPSTMTALEADFRARGGAWGPVANALRPEHGQQIQLRLRQGSAAARLPLLTIG